MTKDKIRFRRLVFDWFKQTVRVEYIVGTQDAGGYENECELSFQFFESVIDTKRLQDMLFKQENNHKGV